MDIDLAFLLAPFWLTIIGGTVAVIILIYFFFSDPTNHLGIIIGLLGVVSIITIIVAPLAKMLMG